MGFPTKNDHFGVFLGYHHFRKPRYSGLWTNPVIQLGRIIHPLYTGYIQQGRSYMTLWMYRWANYYPQIPKSMSRASSADSITKRPASLHLLGCAGSHKERKQKCYSQFWGESFWAAREGTILISASSKYSKWSRHHSTHPTMTG